MRRHYAFGHCLLYLPISKEFGKELDLDKGGDSKLSFSNWRAIIVPANDWNHMEVFQRSTMRSAVSGPLLVDRDLLTFSLLETGNRTVNLSQAGRNKKAGEVRNYWKTVK